RREPGEPLYREALADLEGGTDPVEVNLSAILMCRLAQLHQQRKEYARAEPLLRRALVKAAANKAVQSMAKIVLGQIYFDQERLDKAEPLFREGIEAGKGIEDAAPVIDTARYHYAVIRRKTGHPDEAEKQLREIIREVEATPGKEPGGAFLAVLGLLDLYTETGKTDQALELAGRVPALARRATPASGK